MGLLFALAMALSFLESLLPALPMLPPGIRLGLSNIVTMYALFVLGPVSGYTIAVLKALFVLLTRGAVAAAMYRHGHAFQLGCVLVVLHMNWKRPTCCWRARSWCCAICRMAAR